MYTFKDLDTLLIKSKMFEQNEIDAIKKYCQDNDGLNIGYVIAACFNIGLPLEGHDIFYLIQLDRARYQR